MKAHFIVGAQYGSEEKERIIKKIEWNYDSIIRVGEKLPSRNELDSMKKVLICGIGGFCNSSTMQLAVDVGITHREIEKVILVASTFPMAEERFTMANQIGWETLAREIAGTIQPVRSELSGVLLQIGRWDEDQFRDAVRANTQTCVALTNLDYIAPGIQTHELESCEKASAFVYYIEVLAGVHVEYIHSEGRVTMR